MMLLPSVDVASLSYAIWWRIARDQGTLRRDDDFSRSNPRADSRGLAVQPT
ncbi:MAG: hypothetical protein WDN24_21115 [Sphingomonas sp.]